MSLLDLQSLKADCNVRREAVDRVFENVPDLAALSDLVKREFANNLYPLLDQCFGVVVEELDAQGEAIEDLIDQSENVLHPEFTAEIVGVFEIGKVICTEIEKFVSDADEITKKRITELVTAFRRCAEKTTQSCQSFTVDLEEFVDEAGEPISPGDSLPEEEQDDQESTEGDDLPDLGDEDIDDGETEGLDIEATGE